MALDIVRRLSNPRRLARTLAAMSPLGTWYEHESVRIIREYDRRLPPAPVIDDPALQALYDVGWVNLGNLGIDVTDLAERARARFETVPQDDPRLTGIHLCDPMLLPGCTAYLGNPRVNALLRAYMGPDTTFDVIDLFRIPEKADFQRISGFWHHDRVGHRLLLWVLLNDIDERGRGTWYVPGSHHWEMERNSYAASRYSEEWVHARWSKFDRVIGKKGDAVLLDTHGLHRATYERVVGHRDVIMLGWSSYAKSMALQNPILDWPVGIHTTLLPKGFDTTGTLVRRDRLREERDCVRYDGNTNKDAPRPSITRDAVWVEAVPGMVGAE